MIDDLLRDLLASKYIKISLRKKIIDTFRTMVFDYESQANVDKLINIIPTGRVNKSHLKLIDEQISKIGKIGTIHSLDMNKNSVHDPHHENSMILLNNTLIEHHLDDQVKKYNEFSAKHPMELVTFHKDRYMVKFMNHKMYISNLNDACAFAIDKLTSFLPKNIQKINITMKKNFEYQNHQFIVYLANNMPYFDIRHIIQHLQIGDELEQLQYGKFANNIIGYNLAKNKYGGYYIRELIGEETVYKILLSSNGSFSMSFINDICKLLVLLRKTNTPIALQDYKMENKIKYDKSIGDCSIAGYDIMDSMGVLNACTSDIPCVYLFTVGTVCDLRNIMSINTIYSNNSFVVKFGMTKNLRQRAMQHKKTFEAIDGCVLKLKYFALIKEEYIQKAEQEIKNKVKALNATFQYNTMTELGILTSKQLNDLESFYEALNKIYYFSVEKSSHDAELEAMKNAYESKLTDLRNVYEKKLADEKVHYLNQLLEEKNKIINIMSGHN